MIDPGRIEITPSGIVWRQTWRTGRADWDEVHGFQVVEQRFGRGWPAPKFKYLALVYPDRTQAVFAYWDIPAAELVVLLEQARTRWGRQAKAV